MGEDRMLDQFAGLGSSGSMLNAMLKPPKRGSLADHHKSHDSVIWDAPSFYLITIYNTIRRLFLLEVMS